MMARCIGWSLVLLAALSADSLGGDFETLRARLTTAFQDSKPRASTVNGYVTTLSAAGRWSDIDYADTSITPWAPDTHLERMLEIAKAYSDPSHSLFGSATLRDALVRGFDGWVAADPQSGNWWYNQISVPTLLGKTLLLSGTALGDARMTTGLGIVARAYRSRTSTDATNTGANRIDRALATLVRGAITRDTPLTTESFLAVGDTLVSTTGEGIQADGSFHQHGNQPQSGSYGLDFAVATAAITGYGAGTAFGLPEDNVREIVDYFLDGQQWFIRGRSFDATMMGRSVSRPSARNAGSDMIDPVTTVLGVTTYRGDELAAFQRRLTAAKSTGSADPALALVGNRHFWRSDVTAHHRPGYSASVKISSTRTLEPEMANGEGLKSLHLADGVNLVLQRGDEYNDIAPIWDWRRLPGTTTEQAGYSLTPAGSLGVRGSSVFAGGVSDGTYGATVFDYGRRNVAAHKSWFFFEDEQVALGAGIDAPNASAAVITTVNQVFRRSSISWGTSGTASGTLTSGTVSRGDTRWVHQDGVGYVFPQATGTVTIRAATQTGSWSSVNATKSGTTVSGDVFSLQVDHGLKPSGGSYAYIVLPGFGANAVAAYAAAPRVRVLANQSDLQAVRHDGLGLTQAAFFTSGTLDAGGGLSLAVRAPAAVMLDERPQGITFSAANPAGVALTLRADIRRELPENTGDFARVTLRLPGGDQGGATVGRELDRPARPTYVANFRETAAATAALVNQWTFEGVAAADRLAAAAGPVGLVPRTYGTQATAADIAYGPGLDASTTAMSPLRLGRLAESAGGAALATTEAISFPSSFTIEALVRPDLLESGGVTGFAVMAGGWQTGTRGYFIAQREGGGADALATIIGDSLTEPDNVATTMAAATPSHWYYVANTYSVSDGQTLVKSYVADVTAGQTVASVAVSGQQASGAPPASAVMGLGGLVTSAGLQEAWSGSIDEVAVYGRALNAAEIQARLASLYTVPAQLSWAGSGTAAGGAATWTATGRQWTVGASRTGWSPDSVARFTGVEATVTVGGTVAVNRGLAFAADGVTLAGGSVVIGGTAATIDVVDGARAVVAAMLSGTGGFRKTGEGTLVLSQPNAFTGATWVDTGTLALGASGWIGTSPIISVASGAAYDVAAVSSYALQSGQTIKGNGTVVGNVVFNGGSILSPGNSTGMLAESGTAVLASDGLFQFEINDATGMPGSTTNGWDLFTVGSVLVTASTTAPFRVDVVSLNALQQTGSAANFNGTSRYAWKFISAGTPITTFAANLFAVNPSGFLNASSGTFGIARGDEITGFVPTATNRELYVTYTAPVPEPATWVLAALGAGCAAAWRRATGTREARWGEVSIGGVRRRGAIPQRRLDAPRDLRGERL
jgi:chondroitin AC lyase